MQTPSLEMVGGVDEREDRHSVVAMGSSPAQLGRQDACWLVR